MMQLAALVMAVIAATPGWLGMGYVWSSSKDGSRVLHVQKVVPGGPSDRGGIKPGDVITTINDRRVDIGDELDLLLFLGDRQPGDTLTFGVVREGRAQKVRVKLGTMPDASRAAWKQNLEVARQKRLAAAQQRR